MAPQIQKNCKKETLGSHFSPKKIQINSFAIKANPNITGKEIKAPKGYELSDRVVKVEINGKGVFIYDEITLESDNTVTFNFENKKIEVPQTGDNSHIKLALGILLLATLGLAYFGIKIYKSHKDNNNK